ncbi:MAG TPA: protein kinase, partial [Polyangiaceae bacterium]|nr:protein kinase [Polyangiaceae bacterium]
MRSWAALEMLAHGNKRIVVVERVERRAFAEGELEDWIRDARRIQSLEHPNIARVRDVVPRSDHVLVVADFVDGVRWSELASTASLETALRVAADTLAGLGALHNLRDAARTPVSLVRGLVHGALTPDCLIVGLDGSTRITGVSRPRSATARLAGSAQAHLAPEVLLEDESADARADVYSVGVLLWEALSKRPFLPNLQSSAIVTQLLSGRVPAVTLPADAPWTAPLGELVMRALSADPDKRFASTAAMAADLRRVCTTHLPTSVRVGASVRATFGDAIRARREALERSESHASDVSLRASRPSRDDFAIDITDAGLEPEASQTASTVPPPGDAHAVRVAVPEPPALPMPRAAPMPMPVPEAAVLRAPLPPAPGAVVPAPPAPPIVAPEPPVLRAVPARPPVPVPVPGPEAPVMTTAAPLELPPLQPVFAAAPADPVRPAPSRRVAIIAGTAALLGAATWWLSAKGPAPAPRPRTDAVDTAPSVAASSIAAPS